jgi:hypothetical protein
MLPFHVSSGFTPVENEANAPSSTTTASNAPMIPTSTPPIAGSTTRSSTGAPAVSATSSPDGHRRRSTPASMPREITTFSGPTPHPRRS